MNKYHKLLSDKCHSYSHEKQVLNVILLQWLQVYTDTLNN